MRTLIYARYSSQLQDKRSIEDQIRVCTERCAREGWTVVDTFTDYEISGKIYARPGLQAMLERVAAGGVEQVMAEALDRIARSQVDTPLIHQKVIFAGARLFTLSQGEVTELHTAFQGAMDALQLKELAAKVRRGQRGRTAAGFSFGAPAYGYRIVRRIGPNGEIEKGLREIEPDEAPIVRRIFEEIAAGRSALMVARDLNREGVPGPSGGLWRPSTINGDRIRRNGIVQNDLYAGRLVYNKTRKESDPETRRKVIRSNPPSSWQTTEVPHLRIVSEAQWAAVSEWRERIEGVPFHAQKRPKRLLSGLGRCGTCGGNWILVGVDRWGCTVHKDGSGRCSNGRTITAREFERRVLGGLQSELLDPDAVEIYAQAYRRQFAELARDRDAAARQARRTLEESNAKIARLIVALEDGGSEFAEVRVALARAKEDARDAQSALQGIERGGVTALHPKLPERYRKEFDALMDALKEPAGRDEAAGGIRELVERIVVSPAEQGRGTRIEIFGRINTVLALAAGERERGRMFKVVPGVRHDQEQTLLRAVV